MTVYDITLGANRSDMKPTNHKWEWKEVVDRMKKVERAAHTMASYESMTKTQKTDAKDVGFFIGGITDKRKVIYRQIISLDIEEQEVIPALRELLNEKQYVIHSTHGSTEEQPMYRVIVPLSRIVQADEYGALLCIISDLLNIPVDISAFDFNRIMFLPSIPQDAEYFFEEGDGEPLDVDEILSKVEKWQDLSRIDEKKIRVKNSVVKTGVIGAFCRKVSIYDALDKYLSDIWTKENNGRYTLKNSTTVCGGVIIDGKYLCSMHYTDHYAGKIYNAYDVINLYKYGGGKSGEANMANLCSELGVKPEDGGKLSDTLSQIEDLETKKVLSEELDIDKNGNVIKSLKNAKLILEYDPDLKGVFAYDQFSEAIILKRSPYWRSQRQNIQINEDCIGLPIYDYMEDMDESYLRLHFEEKYDYDARATLKDALVLNAQKNAFHPIRDYLSGLTWDNEPRLERIFIDCFGVKNTLYAREAGLKFFVGAVRRVFIPASKMDYIPVLVSDEGMQKSKFVKRIAKLWGSDTFYTFTGSKEAYEQLRGVWILEIPELSGVQKSSTNSRKAFVTKSEDRYRAAYLKYTKTYKRQCVFIASSNDVVFLDDPNEDGRRWWGLLCNPYDIKINVGSEEFLQLIDQYWAEAVHHYKLGVLPMLSERAEEEARLVRQIHRVESVEEGALIEYLNMPVPEDWYQRSLPERKRYWSKERRNWSGKPREAVCTTEVAREFFELERGEITPFKGRQVGDSIRATKMFIQDGSRRNFGEYGRALAWIRIRTLTKAQKAAANELKEDINNEIAQMEQL